MSQARTLLHLICALALACASACTPLASKQARPARSTLSCAQHVLETQLPRDAEDDVAHCLAAGFIARYCSVSEAYIAAMGKELRDALGPGDAQWRDWGSDRRGIRCAKEAGSDEDLYRCCAVPESASRTSR